MINLSRNANICCGLKKVVAKSRAWVNFEQQILALLHFFIKLATCHTTNLLMLSDKLRVFVSRILPALGKGDAALSASLLLCHSFSLGNAAVQLTLN